jgi:hypothetical protein
MVDATAVRAWLKRKGVDRCPACGSESLRVSKDLYALVRVNEATGVVDARQGSRVVRVRCANCAHLTLLHARQMGLDPA